MKHLAYFESHTSGERLLTLTQARAHGAPGDVEDVSKWLHKKPEELLMVLQTVEISAFSSQIEEMEEAYPNFPKDERRSRAIERLVKSGEPAKAIYVDASDNYILEGRHRLVAFKRLGMKTIQVIYCS